MSQRQYPVVDDNADFGAIEGAALTRVKELFPGTPLFRKPFDTDKLVAGLEALAQKAGVA